MVVIKLQGGLGNQMFQYALGRKVEIKKGAKVKYDYRFFQIQDFRKYELSYFGLNLDRAGRLALLAGPEENTLLWRIIKKVYQLVSPSQIVKEETFAYDERFLREYKNAYFIGYWQTDKYFADIRDHLLKDFTFRQPLNAEAKKAHDHILSTNSVSIHFRRGDYLIKSANIFQVCDWSYYEKAIYFIASKVPNPHFFIFSDDPAWCRENIKLPHPFEVVDANNTEETNHLDMFLMSQCQHNIIANSSFSWWAGWLNQNDQKIVIAPRNWFSDKTISTKDIIPETWEAI